MIWSIFSAFYCTAAWANEPIATVDRPTNGTAAFVVNQGALQIETGVQVDGNLTQAGYSTPTMLRIGVHDRIELRPYASLIGYEADLSTFSNPGIQSKIHLFSKEEQPLALGLVLGSDMDFDNGAASSTLLLDFWHNAWSGWLNTGITRSYAGMNDLTGLLIGGIAYALPQNQGLFVESTDVISQGHNLSIEGGYYKTFSQVQVDIYLLKDLSNSNQWQFATGFAWKFR